MSEIEDKFIKELVENQQDIPADFAKVIDEHFWDLVGDTNDGNSMGVSPSED